MGNESNATTRQERAIARRAQILEAAAGVIAEKGFSRATTREIAAAAGVSEGTIYNYFDSKEDLLVGIMGRIVEIDRLGPELASLHGSARQVLVSILRQRMDHMAQGQALVQALLPEMLTNPSLRGRFLRQYLLHIATLLEQYLQACVEGELVRPINIPLTVRLILAMFVGLIVLRMLGDELLPAHWSEIPDTMTTLILDGLEAPE